MKAKKQAASSNQQDSSGLRRAAATPAHHLDVSRDAQQRATSSTLPRRRRCASQRMGLKLACCSCRVSVFQEQRRASTTRKEFHSISLFASAPRKEKISQVLQSALSVAQVLERGHRRQRRFRFSPAANSKTDGQASKVISNDWQNNNVYGIDAALGDLPFKDMHLS